MSDQGTERGQQATPTEDEIREGDDEQLQAVQQGVEDDVAAGMSKARSCSVERGCDLHCDEVSMGGLKGKMVEVERTEDVETRDDYIQGLQSRHGRRTQAKAEEQTDGDGCDESECDLAERAIARVAESGCVSG